jgi:hypothetical protein
MLCAKGHTMPDNLMMCPTCVAKKGDEAFRDLQVEFLRKVIRGEFSYSLRVAKSRERHVMMYASTTRTFCGLQLEASPNFKYEAYDTETLSHVCAGCRIEIARLVAEEDGAP